MGLFTLITAPLFAIMTATGLLVALDGYAGGLARIDGQQCDLEAPVSCPVEHGFACCPEFMFCRVDALGQSYCCPKEDEDCLEDVTESPQCASPKWELFLHETSEPDRRWCCEKDADGMVIIQPSGTHNGSFGGRDGKVRNGFLSTKGDEKNHWIAFGVLGSIVVFIGLAYLISACFSGYRGFR
ncbi:hypothetical protein ACO1O0_005735 [Amphichorda felina]